MRKFLDFVVRDDPPISTPPSEDESGFDRLDVESSSSAREQDSLVVPIRKDEVNELVHQFVERTTINDDASTSNQVPHQPEGDGSHPRVSQRAEYGEASESRRSDATIQSAKSSQTTIQTHGQTNGETTTDAEQGVKRIVTATAPFFAIESSKLNSEVPLEGGRNYGEALQPNEFRQSLKNAASRSDHRLRNAASVLAHFALDDAKNLRLGYGEDRLRETRLVVGALREIAETMVWADQHEPSLWDTFMECTIMPLLLRCLQATKISSATVGRRVAERHDSSSEDAKRGPAAESNGGDATNQQQQIEKQYVDPETEKLPESTISEEKVRPQSVESQSGASLPNGRDVSNSSSDQLGGEESSAVDLPVVTSQYAERVALEVQSQVLQTISIMIQSIFRQHSLLCLFSSNHINEILSFDFRFEDDEVLGYFMSAVKTTALKLDSALLQLFFDPSRGTFPLYRRVVRFFDHPEQMVRIAVRNITLTIYALGDSEVLEFAARDKSYFNKTVELLTRLCGNVAHSFELLIDDGREVRRTRSRTGIFRRKVRISEVAEKLEEAENLLAYLTDVASLSKDILRPLIERILLAKLVKPFFRPLASRASPRAVLLEKKWRLTNRTVDPSTPTISVFDAAARCLLLACILRTCRSSCLGHMLVDELSVSTSEFENRSVLNGLKAMAADFTGTERVSFVSLCAIESFLLCDATTKEKIRSVRYDFNNTNSTESLEALENFAAPLHGVVRDAEAKQGRNVGEPLLMTLSEFEAPLTPASSLPSTPKYVPPSPSDSSTSPKGMVRLMSANSLPADGMAISESIEPDKVITMFQRGETSLRDMISSIILVVRRREVRTLRTICATCRIFTAIGAKTNNHNRCVEVSRGILNEIASVMQLFLRNKETTIVAIERMFENFRSVAVENFFESNATSSLETILSPDAIPVAAGDYPKGAGKRRRASKEDATPPTEIEDALALFAMLQVHEEAMNERMKEQVVPQWEKLRRSEGRLPTALRQTLMDCNLDDSYLDKRDAMLDIASAVLGYEDVN